MPKLRERLALPGLTRGKRPQATLLHVCATQVVRVEADARGEPLGEPLRLDIACPSVADLPSATATALAQGAAVGQRLWLLYDGLPAHALALPAAQVAGLKEEALNQALLFEAEQETGFDMARQRAAHVLLGERDGRNRYWVTHVPAGLLLELRRTAAQFRCRFGGLLHPGGLPQALSPKAPETGWARLEAWPNVLLGIARMQASPPQVDIFQIGSRQHRLQSELDRWQHDLPVTQYAHPYLEVLSSHTHPPILLDEAECLLLERESVLAAWLAAWTGVLAQAQAPLVPILRPGHDPRRELRLSLALGAAALSVCLLHFGWQNHRTQTFRAESSGRKAIETRLQTLQMSVRKSREKRDELRNKLSPAKGPQAPVAELLEALRRRPAVLLRELALNATDGLVLEEIRTRPEAVTVKGVCLNVGEANALAAVLESRLHEAGWHVAPPRKKDLALAAGGGPWEFEITLMDAGIRGFAALEHPAPEADPAPSSPAMPPQAGEGSEEPNAADASRMASPPTPLPPAEEGRMKPLPQTGEENPRSLPQAEEGSIRPLYPAGSARRGAGERGLKSVLSVPEIARP